MIGGPEYRLRELLASLDRLMSTRGAIEGARADAVAKLDAEASAVIASETGEELAASIREHSARSRDVGRLDAELDRLDAARVRALRAMSTAAACAALDAAEDETHNRRERHPASA